MPLLRRAACMLFLAAAVPLPAQQEFFDEQDEDRPFSSSWLNGDSATGDWRGLRTTLNEHGVDLFGGYAAEVWGNTTGGLKQGTVYTGLLDFGANVDFGKLVGWEGASFSTTWLWISGRDASEDLVGNFLTISNIAGFNTLRMLEMWFQQNLLGDRLSIRIGQITADSEFIISDYGAVFLNGTFGWPAFAYMNLPNGGPGYPMGAPGVRLALNPVDWFTFQTAVFQGDVFAQNVNRHGFDWRLNRRLGWFFINEAQFRWNHGDAAGLPGQLKFGAWFHTADFAAALGEQTYWGDSGYYAVIDQQIFHEPVSRQNTFEEDGKSVHVREGTSRSDQGLGWFGRISFDPQDRNFIGFYVDTGLVYTGPIPGRDNDNAGLAFAYAGLTPGAARTLFDDGSRRVGAEMVLEATYTAQITPWLHIQPDAQYIMRPGGTGDLGNAFVLGGRVSVTF
jgi:Carbohydrate-selective porin